MMRDTIISLLQPIQDGKTIRVRCPGCGKIGCFTATIDGDVIVYNCYSASCPIKGSSIRLKISGEERIYNLKNRKKESPVFEWKTPAYWIDGIGNDACYQYMLDKHLMGAYTDGRFRPMFDPAERRFIFPIKNDRGNILGAIGRSLNSTWPKILNYNSHYTIPFVCGSGEIAFLVEDCASAVAVTRNPAYVGVSLLGTSLRKNFISHLTKYEKIIIALDADAYNKSLKLKNFLTPYVKHIKILKLKKDIKDMTNAEFEQICI